MRGRHVAVQEIEHDLARSGVGFTSWSPTGAVEVHGHHGQTRRGANSERHLLGEKLWSACNRRPCLRDATGDCSSPIPPSAAFRMQPTVLVYTTRSTPRVLGRLQTGCCVPSTLSGRVRRVPGPTSGNRPPRENSRPQPATARCSDSASRRSPGPRPNPARLRRGAQGARRARQPRSTSTRRHASPRKPDAPCDQNAGFIGCYPFVGLAHRHCHGLTDARLL